MRSGKISESILKRSVLKEIHAKNEDVITGAGVGIDAAVIKCDDSMVCATTTVTLGEGFWGELGIIRVWNDIACMGGRMQAAMVNITLPEDFDEKVLKSIMRQSDEVSKRLGVQIVGGHTEISGQVLKPLVSYTGFGNKMYNSSKKIKPGDKIAITKWIGMEGAYLLTQYKEEELKKRFPAQMIEPVRRMGEWLTIHEEAYLATEHGASFVHNLSNGGVLNGLWELSVRGKCGIRADFKKIPVRQEIIEICELFDLNPYQLLSGGSLLMTIPQGSDTIEAIKEQGIPVCIIGEVTGGNDKILINEDEIRYLDVPARDELWKIFNEE